MKKAVLITGGAGFIGSHLCEKFLSLNYQVVCVDNLCTGQKKNISHLLKNPHFKFLKADVTDKKIYQQLAINNQPFSYILHFASPAGANPDSPLSYYQLPIKTYLVNSIATHYLLELAWRKKAEFIFASSSEIYGDPKQHPQKESYVGHVNPIGPRSCYDISKRFGEMATFTFGKKHKLKTKIVRIFNTYGPRMNPKDGRAIPLFVTQALKNKPISIFGTGKQTRSFCYIDDLVDGITSIVQKAKANQVYNLGNPKEISINQLIKEIVKLTKSCAKIQYQKALKDDPKKRCPDISKIKKLGWKPKTPLEKGLRETIAYFSKNT